MKNIKILGLVLLMVSACSWRSPDSKFYMMTSRDLAAMSEKNMNISVAKVKVPDLLDRTQMVVYEKDSNQIEIMEFNRWGETLPDVLRETIVNDLIAYLPNSYVKRANFDLHSYSYSINVEINNIRAYKGDKVILEAWWNVADEKGKVLLKNQSVYEAKADENSIDAMVKAQENAVHMLSADIARSLIASNKN